MSKRKKASDSTTMLELWRPPQGAGDPIGCLATTYTFTPGLFDEQCLARFLEIESEPNREDLAFLLERERLLGGVYAGVLVDHSQAGIEHSLRWDVLPVRIPYGKQHAKLSLLAWSRHVRIIVASANLSEPGYRTNFEVAGAVDLTPAAANMDVWAEAVAFLRSLLRFVPGAADEPTECRRASAFLDDIDRRVRKWEPLGRAPIRQRLTLTVPADGQGRPARSSLEEAFEECRRVGGSPSEARVASPFFDLENDTSGVTASLCKMMARGIQREVCFCVPAVRDGEAGGVPRLAAPKGLFRTPGRYQTTFTVAMLPDTEDKNHRPWHAKVMGLGAEKYSALMIGSSNFTSAGMGVGRKHNAEANLLTVVSRVEYGRDIGRLEALWPDMEVVSEPDAAEWLGTRPGNDDDRISEPPPPAGFLSATYHAGENRRIVLRLAPSHLPVDWSVHACGQEDRELLASTSWQKQGSASTTELPWSPVQPPEKLRVQ